MAKYVEIRNANGNVIIDDEYAIPKFLMRGKLITTDSAGKRIYLIDGNTFKYSRLRPVMSFTTLRELGFDLDTNAINVDYIIYNLMLFTRTSSEIPYFASISYTKYDGDPLYYLNISCGTDVPSVEIEYCIYTSLPMIPCKFGAQAFNADGKLIFDAMRGYMQVVGSMYGGVNVRANPAATYRFTVPVGLDAKNLFISQRSTLPFYSAYKIGSNGVGYGETYFYPRIRMEGSQTMVVELVQQYNVDGSNSAKSYSNYYENVIYCPYREGPWVSGV
ncbi:hypothetical protein [Acinetobacter pullicarnis]|uniref:hypothetical protein n=1 Tax=Acinetobacter pullicarnis TaxID=2576829 RepID=UPI00111E1B73|nr:hypothetical protein [Acinetobacter pullicarnis]